MIIRTKIEIPLSDENKALASQIAVKFNVTLEDVVTIAVNQFKVPIDISDDTSIINARIKSELAAMKIKTGI